MIDKDITDDFTLEIASAFSVALQDAVTPNLVGVVFDWNDTLIFGAFLYDGAIGETEEEIVSDVEGEVISHFNDHMIDLVAVGTGMMIDINKFRNGTWVYRRPE